MNITRDRGFVSENYPLSPDADLEREGVDSLARLTLLLVAEEEFGFAFHHDVWVREDLTSLGDYATVIERTQPSAKPA